MKQIFRWIIFIGTVFFLGKALKDNWLGISSIGINSDGWAILAIAMGVTLLAHTWAGWIWTWILQELNQPVISGKFIQVYLQTNIAKYLPGNVWHYYGRILALKAANISPDIATISVLLEPLLMATAAAIFIVLFGNYFFSNNQPISVPIIQLCCLFILVFAIHPFCLNPLIRLLSRGKTKKSISRFPIQRYPLRPLLGELGFLGLRGTGFILTVFALNPVNFSQIPLLFATFSLAWLLGLVVPFAPGGLGVFEATAIAILEHRFPTALIISAIALYRLVSIIAEIAGASLSWLDQKLD